MNIYNEIKNVLQKRRDSAIKEANKREAELKKYHPKLNKVLSDINDLSIEMARDIIINGNKNLTEYKQKIDQLNLKKSAILFGSGLGNDYLDVHYYCNICQDTGYVNGKPCSCYKEALAEILYKNSNIKEILEKENFKTFNERLFSDQVDPEYNLSPRKNILMNKKMSMNFIDDFEHSKNLLFYGKTGLGKTFLCNCIANELINQGYIVIYETAFKIIDTISDYRFSNNKTKSSKLEYDMILNADLLIIDDLGTEMVNNFSKSEWFNIINSRLLNNKKTIISTNFEFDVIKEKYGDRIASRLYGHYTMLPFFGKDLRWE